MSFDPHRGICVGFVCSHFRVRACVRTRARARACVCLCARAPSRVFVLADLKCKQRKQLHCGMFLHMYSSRDYGAKSNLFLIFVGTEKSNLDAF